ncbi:MAG: hypothetical protein MZV70_09700 [Desulfobacterales bacterium]|nr:hypothetical protein [Desulfobacterales bacterium]
MPKIKPPSALLPGSRLIGSNQTTAGDCCWAAEILAQKIPDIQFVLPLADTLEEKIIFDISKVLSAQN